MTTIFEELSTEDHAFLEQLCRLAYLGNASQILAIALHRGTGWPLVTLTIKKQVRHIAVRSPDDIFYDARGACAMESFVEYFLGNPEPEEGALPYRIRKISEKRLLAKWPEDEMAIQTAARFAEALWPKLPWRNGSAWGPYLDFAQALERLSRERGIWVDGLLVMISEPGNAMRNGDNRSGYALRPTANGICTIERHKEPPESDE